MRRLKSPGQAQRFLSAFGPILDHFRPKRHRLPARDYRALMQDRFQVWNEVTAEKLPPNIPPSFPILHFFLALLPFPKKLFHFFIKLTIPSFWNGSSK
jgi:hypothetical protein